MNCSDPEHTTERDSMVQDMLVTMIEACHSNIPIVGGKTVKTGNRADTACIPGWKEEVVPFQEDARFWHSVWSSAGRPNRGDLHVNMASSRNRFHYAVRRARKNADLVRAQKLFHASEVGCMDLLQEMKNVRNGGKSWSTELTLQIYV